MKSQKGFALLKLVLKIIVLMLLVGVTAYVVFQDNGIIDREEQNIVNALRNDEEIVSNEDNQEQTEQ